MNLHNPLALLAFAIATTGSAQLSEGGTPWSLFTGADAALVPTVHTSGIDRATVDEHDARRAEMGLPPADARMLAVNAELATSGIWDELPNGDGVWRLRVESPGALATELFFQDFDLPTGGRLYVYTPDGSEVLGGFTAYHNKASGIFATASLPGEACIVEYYEPAAVRGLGRFTVASLGHTYRDLAGDRADDCEVDVNCSEGAGWEGQRDGVVKLRIVDAGDIFFCTGGLMNNVMQDCTRYILTALHCGVGVSDADFLLWKFYFNYQRTGCGTGSASQSRVLTGSFKRGESNDGGGNTGSDFLLLEMEDEINPSWTPFWLGWDASTSSHVGGKCIHHPAGDEKKISTFTGTAQNTTQWNGLSTHYRVTWSATANGWGVTEGGSSGSPLFNSDKRVIGTLTGGGSYCNSVVPGGQTQPDYFGRMNYHWSSNAGPSTERLKNWLDPQNTGTLVLDGSYDPCITSIRESATLERPLLAPNPASDLLRVTYPTDVRQVERIEVYDIAGHVVLAERASTMGNATLDVGRLASGTYQVRLIAAEGYVPAAIFQVIR